MRKTLQVKHCVLALSLAALPMLANAAGLGRMSVLSSLGEPFRGQIEIVGVQPSEADSLLVKLGSPDAHEAAQLPYPGSMGLRFNVEKRKNGRYVVLVNSSQAVTEPFMDLIVELYWDGGNVKREFTALIDPPNYRAPVSAADAEPRYQPDTLPGVRSSGKVKQGKKAKPADSGEVAAESVRPAKDPAQVGADGYTVKSGDTLSAIARKVQPEGVSLDQVLLALYRANPQAFEGNMNRLKRGKIMQVPSADEMKAVSAAEASREVKVQTSNWQAYRTKLGEAATRAPAAEAAPGAASGKITPKMEDRGASAPDASKSVLQLSRGDGKAGGKGDANVKAMEDEAAAKKKSLEDANKRVNELQKNVKDMEQYLSAKGKASAASAVTTASTVAIAPASAASAAIASASDASAAVVASVASEASAVASEPVAKKPKRRVQQVEAPVEEPGLVDMLMENIVPVGGGVLALLAGIGGLIFMRRRQRTPVFEDSIITGSDLKANTVLGSTGGGVISTQPTENSFLTDFSRQGLGTIDTDEVDPIAEADVYMAYGRNAQAEEILKDALAKDPNRAEIRLKLLEIYSAGKDRASFDAVARDLHSQTGGKGAVWDEAAKMGRALDPENALFALAAVAAVAAPAVVAEIADNDVAAEEPVLARSEPESVLDFSVPEVAEHDLEPELPTSLSSSSDLDFNLDIAPEIAPVADVPETEFGSTGDDDGVMALDLPIDLGESSFGEDLAVDLGELPELDMADEFSALDLNLGSSLEEGVATQQQVAAPESDVLPLADNAVDLDFNFDLQSLPDAEEVTAAIPHEDGMDSLSDLNLDFAAGSDPSTELDLASDDPVQTKIDLARAYIDMGDVEGAREILQEAMQEGNADQKSLAQSLLSGI